MAPALIVLAVAAAAKAAGSIAQGNSEKAQMDSQALQMKQQANFGYATEQAKAQETMRQTGLIQGKAQAIGAMGGGSTTDVGETNTIASIGQEGEFRSLQDLFAGKAQYENTIYGAYLKKKAGQAAQNAGMISAVGGAAATMAMGMGGAASGAAAGAGTTAAGTAGATFGSAGGAAGASSYDYYSKV